MKKTILLFLLALGLHAGARAQVALKPIVEHFTNTKCSICASKNPGFYANLAAHPEVTHLSIHPSSPYPTCILNQQNKEDNDARTNYYGIYGGTPRLVLNGNPISAGTSYTSPTLFNPILNLTTPFSLELQQVKFSDHTIGTKVVLKTVATTSLSEAVLFVGLVEDTVFVNGGNGEPTHLNVLRNALTDPEGTTVAVPALGDSIVVEFSTAANAVWDFDRMYSLAILQDASNQDVLQTGKSGYGELVSSAQDLQGGLELRIWPNPAHDQVLVELPGNGEAEIVLFSATGQLVYRGRVGSATPIDVSSFNNGLYMAKVVSDGRYASRKLTILH